jgi:hypothetical protein
MLTFSEVAVFPSCFRCQMEDCEHTRYASQEIDNCVLCGVRITLYPQRKIPKNCTGGLTRKDGTPACPCDPVHVKCWMKHKGKAIFDTTPKLGVSMAEISVPSASRASNTNNKRDRDAAQLEQEQPAEKRQKQGNVRHKNTQNFKNVVPLFRKAGNVGDDTISGGAVLESDSAR